MPTPSHSLTCPCSFHCIVCGIAYVVPSLARDCESRHESS